MRNTLRYALGNLDGFDPATDAVPENGMLEIDRWALASLDAVTARVLAGYAAYDFQAAYNDMQSNVLDVTAGEVSAVEAFAAWSLVRLLGSIPITPGGLGVVELGLTTALVGFGGDQVEIVAAVLVYRVATVLPTLAIGLVAGLTWKRYRPDYVTTAPP